MSSHRIASRYAKSLIQLANEQGKLAEVYADMKSIDSIFENSRDLKLMFRSPIIPSDKKQTIVSKLFEGKITDLLYRFLRGFRLHPPDASACLVTIGMRSGHLVVGDDLVVPIDDVDAAVGAVGEGDGAEEGIVAGDEVGELGELPIRAVAMHGDGLDLGGDGIGDGHHMGGLGQSGCGFSRRFGRFG